MIIVRLVGGPLAGIEFLAPESAGPPGGRRHTGLCVGVDPPGCIGENEERMLASAGSSSGLTFLRMSVRTMSVRK